jgi:hypothetical protein
VLILIPLSNLHGDSIEVVGSVVGESDTSDLNVVVADDTVVDSLVNLAVTGACPVVMGIVGSGPGFRTLASKSTICIVEDSLEGSVILYSRHHVLEMKFGESHGTRARISGVIVPAVRAVGDSSSFIEVKVVEFEAIDLEVFGSRSEETNRTGAIKSGLSVGSPSDNESSLNTS